MDMTAVTPALTKLTSCGEMVSYTKCSLWESTLSESRKAPRPGNERCEEERKMFWAGQCVWRSLGRRLSSSRNWEWCLMKGPTIQDEALDLVLRALGSHERVLNMGMQGSYLGFTNITPWRMDWIQTMLEVGKPVRILLQWSKKDTLEAYATVEMDWRQILEIFRI